MPPEWWESFFRGGWASVHSDVNDPERSAAEAELIEEYLALTPGAAVLDVPCGDGRLSIPLAERGYRITGVDVTAEYLDRARRAAAERRVEIAWEHRDMRELPWEAAFDAAFCFFGSFGYFDEGGNEEFVRAVARTLVDGGAFLVDTHTYETLVAKFQPVWWRRIGETAVLESREWDLETGRIETEWTFVRDGSTVVERSSIRVYTLHELIELARAAGFRSFDAFDGRTGEPFGVGSGRLHLVARK